MTFKIKKLDKRYVGSHVFKFMAIPDRSGKLIYNPNLKDLEKREFVEIRNWCWSQWGPSCELRFYETEWTNPQWCWDTEHDKLRIYLQSDKEAAWFKLKW